MQSRYLPFHSDHNDGKVADLIAALAQIPGLGDQLHLRDDRVLMDDVEERPQLVDFVQFAGQACWPDRSGSRRRACAVIQYRRLSMIICSTRGLRMLNVLPQPVKSM